MKNKILLIFAISSCMMLSASYSYQPIYQTPNAVLKAVELGMTQSTAQAMYDDGVDEKYILPKFERAWKKDQSSQFSQQKHLKALEKRLNNPHLKQAFNILESDTTKQLLVEKEQLFKNNNNNERASLSLSEIKRLMSHEEFMAYTDLIWHKQTNQTLNDIPVNNLSNKLGANTLTVGDLNKGCGFPTIAAAVNFAADGDFISVSNEAFTGLDATFSVSGKSLTISGGLDPTCQVFTADRTILQSNIQGPVVEIDVTGNHQVTLSGFDISGAQSNADDFTSGIKITGSGSVDIINTHVHNNESNKGAGISIINILNVNLQNIEVYSNHAVSQGGGIYCENSIFNMSNSKIGRFDEVAQGNSVDTDGLGAGIYAKDCNQTLGGAGPVEISYNDMINGDSIIEIVDGQLSFGHEDSRISFNSAFSIINAVENAIVVLNDLKISDNLGNVVGTVSEGILVLNSLCENNAPCVHVTRNEGLPFVITEHGELRVFKSHLSNNGTRLFSPATVLGFSNNTGGVARIQNSIITEQSNNPANPDVPLFLVKSSNNNNNPSQLTILHTTIANNPHNPPMIISTNGSTVNIDSSIIWGNNTTALQSEFSTGVSVVDSIIQFDTTGMTNTLQTDPEFVDANNGDFHINSYSPAVDLSDSDVDDDIDNEPRPQGLANDAGFDENGKKIGINGAACEYTSIPQAIAAANDGDTIYIAKGTYHGQLGIIEKSLDFVSATQDCTAENQSAERTDVLIDGDNLFSTNGGLFEITNSAHISMTNLTMVNAQANFGGLIYIENGSLTLNDASVGNGTAVFAGLIYVDENGSLDLNGETSLYSGIALNSGGAIVTHSTVNMNDNSHIGVEDFGNQADNGGGVYCAKNAEFNMNDNSSIYANSSSSFGGGIVLLSSDGPISVTLNDNAMIGHEFDSLGNTASRGAGIGMSTIEEMPMQISMFDNSSIQHNTTITNGVFLESGGAGMALHGAVNVNLHSGSIKNNKIDTFAGVDSFGAGIMADAVGNLTFGSDFIVSGNIALDADAPLYGGGLALLSPSMETEINGSLFSGNTADFGGGIFTQTDTEITINTGTELITNNAHIAGGAIYAKESKINNNGAVTYHTNASVNGGAVFVGSSEFRSESSLDGGLLMSNNSATNNGGAIHLENTENIFFGAKLILNDAILEENNAANKGGAIYMADTSTLSILDSKLTNNTANYGGALAANESLVESYISATDTCILSQTYPDYCSVISGNTSNNEGDAVYLEGDSNLRILHTVINHHDHSDKNTLVLNDQISQFTISNSLLHDNGVNGVVSKNGQLTMKHVTLSKTGLNMAIVGNSMVTNSIIWDSPVNVPFGVSGECNITPNAELPGGSGDPLFYTNLDGPFQLPANSPAVDACLDDNGFDLNGRQRPINTDGIITGLDNDMGAFERPLFGHLTVSVTGFGSVVSDITGIDCGIDCNQELEIGSQIELTANPDAGYAFKEWTGACAGHSAVCTIPIDGVTQTQAIFAKLYTVTVELKGHGPGLVLSSLPGIQCGEQCEAQFIQGTVLTLSAETVDSIHVFDQWQGDCQGQELGCELIIDSDKSVQAYFVNPDIIFKNGFDD